MYSTRKNTYCKTKYQLSRGGWAEFAWEDVQACRPHYENTVVTLSNGVSYLLKGREYGV